MILQKLNKRSELLAGVGLALLTLVSMTFFSTTQVIELATILLASISAIYIGFAIADKREPLRSIEIGTAVLFIVMALLGLWLTLWILIVGFIGHGLWDWLHHVNYLQTEVTEWYPTLCAIYDVIVGVGLIFWIL